MRVLVMGGSGLIGWGLLPDLVVRGHQVTVVTRGGRPLPVNVAAHVVGDRRSVAIPGAFDAVIDNVAYTPEDCQLLLDQLRGRVGHYLVTSTAFVYEGIEVAWTRPSRPFNESDPAWGDAAPLRDVLDGHAAYVLGKQRMERWLFQEGRAYGVPMTIVRPALQIVGPNTSDGRFEWFWRRVQDGGPIWFPEDARHKAGPCQLAFSGDVARLLRTAVETPGEPYRVFNAAQPELWTYEEYIRVIADAVGQRVAVRYAPREQLDRWAGGTYRIPLPYPVTLEVSKAARDLAFQPTPMASWVRQTADWFARNAQGTPGWYQNRAAECGWGAVV